MSEDIEILPEHRGFAFSVTKCFQEHDEPYTEQLRYEMTRGLWKNIPADMVNVFAYAIFEGTCIEVYQIKQWSKADPNQYKIRRNFPENIANRWQFKGEVAPDEVRNKYKDQRIVRMYSPWRYVPISGLTTEIPKALDP